MTLCALLAKETGLPSSSRVACTRAVVITFDRWHYCHQSRPQLLIGVVTACGGNHLFPQVIADVGRLQEEERLHQPVYLGSHFLKFLQLITELRVEAHKFFTFFSLKNFEKMVQRSERLQMFDGFQLLLQVLQQVGDTFRTA